MFAKIALNYLIFAVIATFANILAQDVVVRFFEGTIALFFSICVGTAVGLLVKYELDRRYIFCFYPPNKKAHHKTFLLYSLMGVFTTLIFWGFEWAFHLFFQTKTMRYLGGILGLSIGYCSKYHLDKRYVFSQKKLS